MSEPAPAGESGNVVPIHPNQIVKGNRPVGKGRGTDSGPRGSAQTRRRRKRYLLETYRANVDVLPGDIPLLDDSPLDAIDNANLRSEWNARERLWEVPIGYGEIACRCYRCGYLLTFETMTVDRIVPGCVKTAAFPRGGTYVRNNIRPACCGCQSETGGALGAAQLAAKRKRKKR